jgi:regulator of protease activity HflC (stomatin/prohibitin superfamily)
MKLSDCANYQDIVSAMSEIMEISNGAGWKSDFDQIDEILNEYFDTSKVPMAEIIVMLLDDCNQAITDQDKVISILVKYFGVPKNKINHKERSEIMDEKKIPIKKIVKWVVIGLIGLFIVITCINSCSVVQQRERGVLYHLGVAKQVVEPGLKFKAPYIQKVKKYSIAPRTFEVTFPVGSQGAITKDMQTVGTTVNVKYALDENKIMDVATRYGDSVVESAMKSNVMASVKEVVGTYSIYELVEKQPEVTAKVSSAILARMADYPILISQTTITNWDWSDDFDKQIKETANKAQAVKIAEQEALVAEASAQKKVKEAKANKEAAELDAEAQIAKARGESEAKKIKADADAYEARQIAANQQAYQRQWDYEIQMERAKHWNGKEVPDAAYIVPGTGAVVPLTSK